MNIEIFIDSVEVHATLKTDSRNIDEIIKQVNEKVGQDNWDSIRINNESSSELS